MGKWRRFTGYKKREVKVSTTCLILPRLVYESLDDDLSYPKSKIRTFADTNRKHPTKAEFELHCFFKTHRGGLLKGRYNRQHPISGKWIVDFFFPEVRLAVEVDGSYHRRTDQQKKDRLKDADCKRFEITILRLSNGEVFGDRARLVQKLRAGWIAAKARENILITPKIYKTLSRSTEKSANAPKIKTCAHRRGPSIVDAGEIRKLS